MSTFIETTDGRLINSDQVKTVSVRVHDPETPYHLVTTIDNQTHHINLEQRHLLAVAGHILPAQPPLIALVAWIYEGDEELESALYINEVPVVGWQMKSVQYEEGQILMAVPVMAGDRLHADCRVGIRFPGNTVWVEGDCIHESEDSFRAELQAWYDKKRPALEANRGPLEFERVPAGTPG